MVASSTRRKICPDAGIELQVGALKDGGLDGTGQATREAANVVAKLLIITPASDPVANVGTQHAMFEALWVLRKCRSAAVRKRLNVAAVMAESAYLPPPSSTKTVAVCGILVGQLRPERDGAPLSDTRRL